MSKRSPVPKAGARTHGRGICFSMLQPNHKVRLGLVVGRTPGVNWCSTVHQQYLNDWYSPPNAKLGRQTQVLHARSFTLDGIPCLFARPSRDCFQRRLATCIGI